MKFPFVSRKRYDTLMKVCQQVSAENIRLQIENDNIIGNACALAANERADRITERGHFEAILTNRRGNNA